MLDEHGFAEEVLSLSRTLAEVVISGCYLQIASDEKVESFLAFDSQKSYHMSATLEEFLEPEGIISEKQRDELKAIVAKARARSKRKDTDNSWNTESVYQMAQALDATMAAGTYLFTTVKASTYQFDIRTSTEHSALSAPSGSGWLKEHSLLTTEGRNKDFKPRKACISVSLRFVFTATNAFGFNSSNEY